MRKIIYKSSYIKALICIAAALLILSVWPFRLFKTDINVYNPAQTDGRTEVINYLNNASQIFVATNTHIQYIDVLVMDGTACPEFTVSMYDTNMKLYATQKVEVPKTLPGRARVLLDVDVNPDELYTLRFTSIESLYLGQEPWNNVETVAVSYYNTTPAEGQNIVMDYSYHVPVDTANSFLYIGIIVLAAAVLLLLTDMILKKNSKDQLISMETGLKWTLNPIVAIMLIIFFVMIITGKVTKYAPDIITAIVGTICLGAILYYGINHKRDGQNSFFDAEYVRSRIPEFIQSAAIAMVIQACCEYVSGLYDINHYVAERKELIAFAFVIISMFAAKDIWRLYNLVYLVVAGIFGGVFYSRHVAENTTTDEIFVLKATIIIAILLGFILIRTVKELIFRAKTGTLKCSFSDINPLVVGLISVYFILIVVFRNTRTWTVFLAVGFTLLFINYLLWDRKDTFVLNVVRGVVLQFCLCTIWVWARRPYCTYRCVRYTHFFHTETITATYLTMVGCIAVVLLLSKIRKSTMGLNDAGIYVVVSRIRLASIWKELCFFGVVMTYLIFTMARTAYFAIFVVVIFALIMMIGFKGAKKTKLLFSTVGYMIIAVLITFPAVFEIQRTVPALVSEPYQYDIDGYEDAVMRGRQLSSVDYIMIGRFADIFFDKIFSKETHFDEYFNADDEYNEYHATFKEIYLTKGYTWPGLTITDDMWDTQPDNNYKYAALFQWSEQENIKQRLLLEDGIINDTETFDPNHYYGEKYEGIPEDEFWANHAPIVNESVEDTGDETPKEDVIEASDTILEEASGSQDYTNGRISIYKSYLSQLNMTGHDGMGAILENGEEASHAHDVYLQVAFDHGIPTAIVFVLVGICLFIAGIKKYRYERINNPLMASSSIVLLGFAIAGVVEWTYHFSHPMAITMWLLIAPLLRKNHGK